MFRLISKILDRKIAARLRPWSVARNSRWISGEFPEDLTPSDLVVVCVVRDGAKHLESFVNHYQALGVRHIVFLDNGSEDATLLRARRFKAVTVEQSLLPYRIYKHAMKQYLVNRYGKKCWCLISDIDERFDFPGSSEFSLADFLNYLNRNDYSAVTAQMLDLFADGPPSEWPISGEQLEKHCCWYDLSDVHKTRQVDEAQECDKTRLFHLQGGIRFMGFGMETEPNLTKFPLLLRCRGAALSPHSPHEYRSGRIADLSCLLAHYKFHRGFAEDCRLAMVRKNYFQASNEYQQYFRALRIEPGSNLKKQHAARFRGTDELVEKGFLVVSESYASFIEQRKQQRNRAA